MPSFPIVDAHVHLWDPKRFPMPWLAEEPALDRPYLLEAYHKATRDTAVQAMVYVEVGVEAAETAGEARSAVALAHEDARLQAIVAAAPVEQGERVRGHLETLIGLDPRIKGVRRNLQDEPGPTFCLQPGFIQGVRLLAEYGLSFDLCIRHQQLDAVAELVSRCPGTDFILDHLGKPNIREHVLDPWRTQMRTLARLPNVVCKISGMVTEADHEQWTPADLAPYVTHALEAFGEDRVLFGGDWPVLLLASTYQHWVEALEALIEHLSPAAQYKLWNENARRVYRVQ